MCITLCAAALAHERDPAQDKCTMLNSNATRNLRGATTAQQLSLQAVMPDVGSSPTESGLPGTPLGYEEGPQQADWGWRHHRQQRQRPTGESSCDNSRHMHKHNLCSHNVCCRVHYQRICPFINCTSTSWSGVLESCMTFCPDCHASFWQMRQMKEVIFLDRKFKPEQPVAQVSD